MLASVLLLLLLLVLLLVLRPPQLLLRLPMLPRSADASASLALRSWAARSNVLRGDPSED